MLIKKLIEEVGKSVINKPHIFRVCKTESAIDKRAAFAVFSVPS
jgi:hypothetical protein